MVRQRVKFTARTSDSGLDARKWAWVVGLFAVLVYGNTVFNGYNLDDHHVTMGHRLTSEGLSSIPAIFTSPYYEDGQGYHYEYRPLTLTSFALEHSLLGENAGTSHLVNIVLYGISCVIVLLLMLRLFPGRGLVFPIVVALAFAAHPLHTEVVASIKNRDELLSLLGGLSAALMLLNYLKTGRLQWLLGVFICLILGLLAKMSVVSFVILLPIMAVFRSAPLRQLSLLIAGCCVIIIAVFALRAVNGLTWLLAAMPAIVPLTLRAIFNGRDTYDWAARQWSRVADVSLRLSRFLCKRDVVFKANSSMPLMSAWWFLLPVTGLCIVGVYLGSTMALSVGISLLLLHPLFIGGVRLVVLYGALITVSILGIQLKGQALELPFLTMAVGFLTYRVFGPALSLRSYASLHVAILICLYATVSLHGDSPLNEWSKGLYLSVILLPGYFSSARQVARGLVSSGMFLAIVAGIVTVFLNRSGLGLMLSAVLLLVLAVISSWSMYRPVLLIVVLMMPGFSHYLLADRGHIEPMVSAQLKTENAGSTSLPAPNTIDALSELSAVDRPLTFAEYPLGFDASLEQRLATAANVLGHYISLTVIPHPLSFYYGYNRFDKVDFSNSRAIVSLAAFLALVISAIGFTWRRSPIGLGLWVFIVSILVFSNLVEPVAGMAADRLAYIASLGFCIVLGHVQTSIYEKYTRPTGRRAVVGLIGLILLTYSGITVARNAQWKDSLTLMRHDIKHLPNSAQAHNLLASHLMEQSFHRERRHEADKLRQEALIHFKQTLSIWPGFFNAWYDLGRVYMVINDVKRALPCFKEAHRLDSTYFDATINVAMIAEDQGDEATPIDYYSRCIRLNPDMLQAYTNLSYLYFRKGNYEQSIAINERAIAYNPNWADPYTNIASAYGKMGHAEKAQVYIDRLKSMK